jgi:hypothetical protein
MPAAGWASQEEIAASASDVESGRSNTREGRVGHRCHLDGLVFGLKAVKRRDRAKGFLRAF